MVRTVPDGSGCHGRFDLEPGGRRAGRPTAGV